MDSKTGSGRGVVPFLLFLTASYAVGLVGYQGLARGLVFWYPTLQKPAWSVPIWLLQPGWTCAYGLIGAAAWLIWSDDAGAKSRLVALAAVIATLLLAVVWIWLFFGLQKPWPALVESVALLLAAVASTAMCLGVRTSAGCLLLPVFVWCAYLSATGYAVWRLNPGLGAQLPTAGTRPPTSLSP